MKLWRAVLLNKAGKYKAKYCYNNHHGGYSIEGVLAEAVREGITNDPNENIADWLRTWYPQIGLSKDFQQNEFFNLTNMQVRDIPLWVIKIMFERNLKYKGQTSIRELAILNDQTEMNFNDFYEVFKSCDI